MNAKPKTKNTIDYGKCDTAEMMAELRRRNYMTIPKEEYLKLIKK